MPERVTGWAAEVALPCEKGGSERRAARPGVRAARDKPSSESEGAALLQTAHRDSEPAARRR